MKKEFNKQYIVDNKGCYKSEQVMNLSFIKKEIISINDIIESEISLKDKYWWVIRKCDLTLTQKQMIAIGVAEIVLEIYETKYPDNKVPREAIQAAKDYLAGSVTSEFLRSKRNTAAYAADAYAAYAADAYAAVAYAAYAAVAYAAYAAAYAAVADAAYAYAAAAYAADAAAYVDAKNPKKKFTDLLFNFLKEFIKNAE